MNQMQRDKAEKWKRWARAIHEEVEQLLLRRQVWGDLVKMIGNNPELRKPSVFFDWLPVVYTHTQVRAIRRMADRDKRTASLPALCRPQKFPGRHRRTRY